MFAIIELPGNIQCLINIPAVGAEKSLPQIIKMFEENAVFIDYYRENKVFKPEITVKLGSKYEHKQYGMDNIVIDVSDSPAVLDEDFVIATPEIYTSAKKELAKKDEEIKNLNVKISSSILHIAELKQANEVLVESVSNQSEIIYDLKSSMATIQSMIEGIRKESIEYDDLFKAHGL